MRRRNVRRERRVATAFAAAIAGVAAVAMAAPQAAVAHETQAAGGVRLTIGWSTEPAAAGMANAVEVAVADSAGAPRNDVGESLRVEVLFGDERIVLGLAPTGEPGTLAAPLVPTRAGIYIFHVMGTVAGQVVDITSTCSEQTFDCVTDGAALHFPVRDPASRDLAARLEHESRAVARADRAASDARTLAWVALGFGALTLLTSLSLWRRTRPRRQPQ